MKEKARKGKQEGKLESKKEIDQIWVRDYLAKQYPLFNYLHLKERKFRKKRKERKTKRTEKK